MSDNRGEEWPDEDVRSGQDDPGCGEAAYAAESYARAGSRGLVPTILAWLLGIIALLWIAGFVFYVNRAVGLGSIPQLLPHEIGGILAGMLAPPAVLFALAAWTVRDQQMSYDLAVLEQQIWRMENPHRRAAANLSEVG